MSYVELKSKTVRVRKNHSCAWCAERINVGEEAQYRAYKFEGDFQSDHMHPECYEAMHEVPNSDLYDGWIPGDYKRGSTEGS